MDIEKIFGLLFSFICLAASMGFWYWVWFKEGAEAWKNGMIAYSKKYGFNPNPNVFWGKPLFLKTVITFVLAFAVFSVFLSILEMAYL